MRRLIYVLIIPVLLGTGFLLVNAQSTADIQAQIQALLQQVAALQEQLKKLSTTPCEFARDLFSGLQGEDVKCLQQYLDVINTGFFGNLTKAAVAKWQSANNISPAAGYFGPISRKKYQELNPAPAAPPLAPAPEPTPATPAAPTPPAPAPTPTSSIKTGTGVAINNAYFKIGEGSFLYSGSGLDDRGYLFPGEPEAFIGDRSADEDVSGCESTKAYSYRGLSNICQFTSPSQFNFVKLTTAGVRFYDKTAIKGANTCASNIMAFKQNNLYGAIDFEKIDSENNLSYRYWLDESGSTNFGTLCTAQANTNKLASLLDNLKSVLENLKKLVR